MLNELNGKKVLLTGATGLIGSSIVKVLENYNVKIVAVVRNIEKAKKILGKYTNIDYLNYDIVDIPIENMKIDYVIHAAANTSSESFVDEPVEIIMNAINGTRRILEIAKYNNVKGMVYLSSMEVYGCPKSDLKISEDSESNLNTMSVRSSYPISKRVCENLCASYAGEYKVPVKVIRLTQTFGEGVVYDDKRVFAEFARCVLEKKNIVLKTKGETRRSYLYTKDAAMAVLTVLVKGKISEAYNAANEKTYCSIYEMAKLVVDKCSNNKIKVIIDESENSFKYGYAPTLHMNLDTSKIRMLGWNPTIDLEKMYKLMIEYKAEHLSNLPQWDGIYDAETRKHFALEQKKSKTIVKGEKIGRNDPCPCGSGKKYKKCCGR